MRILFSPATALAAFAAPAAVGGVLGLVNKPKVPKPPRPEQVTERADAAASEAAAEARRRLAVQRGRGAAAGDLSVFAAAPQQVSQQTGRRNLLGLG